MLNEALEEEKDETERCRIKANIALCEAKSKKKLFHESYQTAVLGIFPEVLFFWNYRHWEDTKV